MAFKTSSRDWQTVFDNQVSGGLVDGSGFPLLYNVSSGPFSFNSNAYLRAWEDDGGQNCVTDENKGDLNPEDDGDDSMGLWHFSTDEVSNGFDRLYSNDPGSDPYRHYAQLDYSGDSSGYFYYVYANDSIPFHGKIDELLIFNRPFDAQAIQDMVLAQRLALHLKFDDAPGETSFVDSSFGQHNATCSGSGCPMAGVAGRVNQGTLFSGDDYLTLANSGINRLTNEFSITAWIKPQNVSGFHRIVATARTKSNNGFAFGTYYDGLRFTTYGIKDYDIPSLGIQAGKWTHVAVVVGADNSASFYVNGVFQGKVNGSSPANADSDDALLIGATSEQGTSSPVQFFVGRMDDLYIFSNALGASGIQDLYQQAPIFQMHLNDVQGTRTFADDSDYLSNGTCSGDKCPTTGFWIDGQIGTAAEFDGQDDAISAAYTSKQVFDKTNTLSAWVFPTAVKDDLQPLVINVSRFDGNPQYGLYLKPNSMIPTFRLWNCSTQVELDADVPLIMNSWNHVAATYDGISNRMTIYVNGSPQGSRTKPGNLCYAYGPLQIGGGVNDTTPFAGRLDEVTLYDNPLSAQQIAEIYNYQGKWVEERQSHNISVDDDNPAVALKTSGDRLPNIDVQMLITASDPTSGIQRVQFGVKAPGQSSYTWSDTPACQDASTNSAWCPTFETSGEGAYSLQARATDLVGHTALAEATVYVDDRPPSASFDFSANALLLPGLSATQPNTWELSLSGLVSDPQIGSVAGSGVSASSLQVSLFDANGSRVGSAAQHPSLKNGRWSLKYRIREPYPSGIYTVTLQAADQISLRSGLGEDQLARHSREISRLIQIDAAPPAANLDLSQVPQTITSAQTLGGQASERPVLLRVSWDTDDQGDQVSLSIRCNGQLYHQVQAGTLPLLAESYSWNGELPRGASCQVELADSGGDGGTRGYVEACGEQIASWDGDFGSNREIDFNATASACSPATAVAGLAGVETAWLSVLPGSNFDPQALLPGTRLYLPFDDLATTSGTLSFRDISGNGQDGTCEGESCPAPAQLGHQANAVFFDGLDDQVRVALAQDPGGRDQFSIALWLAPAGQSSGTLLYKEDEFALYRSPDNQRIYWMLGNTSPAWGTWQDSGVVVPDEQWTQFTFVYDQETIFTYANGELVHTANGSGAIPDLSQLLIGGGQGDGYRGLLDDLQLYNRALSSSEVHDLYLGSGPVLHLALDSSWTVAGATLPDQSGWVQDGVFSSGANDPANKSINGKVGTFGLQFDGQNDHITVADSPALDLEAFSIGLWVKPGSWSSTHANPLLFKGQRDGSNLNYGFYISSQGKLEFRFSNAACTTLHRVEGSALSSGTWSQILATYDGSQLSLYQDGKLTQTAAISGGACQNDDPLLVGETLNAATYYRGAIDDLRIYPRALSELEAHSLYAAGWQAAKLSSSGAGVALADWQASVPGGLEGTYRLELRAADTNGVFSQPKAAWQGELDTLDPRLSLTSQVDGDVIRYTSRAWDWNLSLAGFNSPCGSGVISEREFTQSPWYLALNTGEPRLNQLSAQCERSIAELPGEVGAYDTPGLAYGVEISGSLAYIADGNSGLQIVDVADALHPELLGTLPGLSAYTLDIATGGPVLQPDLVMDGLVTDPASPEINQFFAITVTVRNQGSGTARNFVASLFQDSAPAACQASTAEWTATIPQLAAGETASVRFSHSGLGDLNPHALYAKADGICSVAESDETNNLLGPQTVQAVQTELAIGALHFDPLAPVENQPFTVTMAISNTGSLASGIFTTTLYVDQSLTPGSCSQPGWASQVSASLQPGESRKLSFVYPGFANPGQHEFLTYVDSTCTVSESEELNNLSAGQVNILSTPKADLIVENWQVDHNPVLVNQPLVVTATVRNQGTAASGTFTTTVFLNNQPTVCLDLAGAWDSARIANLDPGQAAQVSFTYPGFAFPGQYSFSSQADSHCQVDESNEANNTSYLLSIDVLDNGQPDLVVQEITTDPLAPSIGQPVVISVTLTNQGLGTAQNFDTTFYVDHIPSVCDEGFPDWYFAHTDGLAVGASTVVMMTYSGFTMAGEHHLYAQADGTCMASELDEGNNISQPLTVTVSGGAPIADLLIERISTQPFNPAVGQPFTITVNVRNQGTLATGSFDTGVFINSDPANTCGVAGYLDLQTTALGPWEEATLTFHHPGLLEGGTTDIYAMADLNCSEPEYDESNNTGWSATSVNAAAVALESRDHIQQVQARVDPGATGSLVNLPQVTLHPAQVRSAKNALLAPAVQDFTYAYLATSSGLAILDVSDPASPSLVSTLPVASAPRAVQVIGGMTYLVTQFNGLHAIDTSNPGYPALLDTYDTPGVAEGLAILDQTAFVADGLAGLQLIDISNPGALSLLSNYDTTGYAYGVAVAYPYAYVAAGSGGLQILDISDPLNPQLLGAQTSDCFALRVTVRDHLAYVATGTKGLAVVDVSDPAHPQLVRSFDLPGYANDIEIGTGSPLLAYVANQNAGLRILNPSGFTPQSTACDTAGHCTAVQATESLATLVRSALSINPQAEIHYPLAPAPLSVEIQNLPAVLDHSDPITITGVATSTLTSLQAITVTVDGAPLSVSGWSSGSQESTWQAGWTPAGDGAHLVQATVLGENDSQTSDTVTVTVDTLAPSLDFSPLLYSGADYYEPRTVRLRGSYADQGGVTSVEVRTLSGSWQAANLADGVWDLGWQLAPGPLPDNQDYTVLARASDVAGHVTQTSATLNLDVFPPEAANLTLTANGYPILPGTTFSESSAALVLGWDASRDGSGLDDYQVRWTTQVTQTVLGQTSQAVPTAGPLASTFVAQEGRKVSVELGSTDLHGNQRWQTFGSVIVDSPLTPDYIPLPSSTTAPVYRGWMKSGCSLLGVDRRASRIYDSIAEQRLYTSWDAQALRLAWTGTNWDTAGDLFIYLDTGPGGTRQVYDPFAAGYKITLPDGMLADHLIWVKSGSTARLLNWRGSWVASAEPFALDSFRWSSAGGTWSGLSDLYLDFDQVGLQAGGSLSLLAIATENEAFNLWATLPNANPVNSKKALGRLFTLDDQADFQLSHFYHWDALSAGICPNGSTQPAGGAYLDTDLQLNLAADPAGASYNLLGDGLVWLQVLLLGSPPAGVSAQLDFLVGDQAPLRNGQWVTYTLSYRNLGTDTDYGVSVSLEALYALNLPGGNSLSIGDIAPGESGQVRFSGMVNTAISAEPWAGLAAQVYDAAHPPSGAPLEWLWTHHKVDSRGPEFFGVEQPAYLLRPGLNSLAGYAYDTAGVNNLDIRLQGSGASQMIHCPDSSPLDGSWNCTAEVSGQNNASFTSQLQAIDGYDQSSGWQTGPTFLLDTQPPTLTLDLNASNLVPGSLTDASSFTLYGTVQDNGGLGQVDVCAAGDCSQADLLLEPGQSVVSLEDIPASLLVINSGTTCNGGELRATFVVTQSFNLADVQLGLAAEHADRADLLATLISPAGTAVQLLNPDRLTGTDLQNADFWFRDAAAQDFHQALNVQDPARPFYQNEVRPAQPLHNFLGEPAAGTWTLKICDQDPAADDGAYLRSRLELTPQDVQPKSGLWSHKLQFSDMESMDYVHQQIQVFGQDLVGNRSADPLTLDLIFDHIAPKLQVSSVINSGLLGDHLVALAGSVNDGGPAVEMTANVFPPQGDPYKAKVQRAGEDWQFGLDLTSVGTYTLWVNASDLVGNTSTAGPFEVTVKPPSVIYLPGVMKQSITAPDLVIRNLLVTEDQVELTLENTGNAPVTDEFWVDVYINPQTAPTTVNQSWDQLSQQGLVWGVTDLSTLVPGGTLKLNLEHPNFMPAYSHYSGSFSPDMVFYAQVDLYGDPVFGGVKELSEMNGTAYNNLRGPVSPLPIQIDPQALSTAETQQMNPQTYLLPKRPLEVK